MLPFPQKLIKLYNFLCFYNPLQPTEPLFMTWSQFEKKKIFFLFYWFEINFFLLSHEKRLLFFFFFFKRFKYFCKLYLIKIGRECLKANKKRRDNLLDWAGINRMTNYFVLILSKRYDFFVVVLITELKISDF